MVKIKGIVTIRCVDTNGKVIHEEIDNNLVVALGCENMAHLVFGDIGGNPIEKIGVGTDGTPPDVTDTGITGGYLKAINTGGTSTTFSANSGTCGFEFDTTEANGMTIAEMGLFVVGGVLFARKVLGTPIAKTSSFAITGTWEIRVLS